MTYFYWLIAAQRWKFKDNCLGQAQEEEKTFILTPHYLIIVMQIILVEIQ